MMIIRVFSSCCDSRGAKEQWEKISCAESIPGYGTDFRMTDGDDYTHVIIMNTGMPRLSIPKENVIGFAHEPIPFLRLTREFVQYAQRHIGKYFIGDKIPNLPSAFVEGNAFLWYIKPYVNPPIKSNIMSIMISQKNFAPGHKYRHKLVQKIVRSDLPIDIYGRGCKFYTSMNDPRFKGPFEEADMCKMVESYQFHICIENYQCAHYFSEKIINPLLAGTTPVYLGCKNIESYFPGTQIDLSGDVDRDFELLKAICADPSRFRKSIDVAAVESKVNMLKNVRDLFA